MHADAPAEGAAVVALAEPVLTAGDHQSVVAVRGRLHDVGAGVGAGRVAGARVRAANHGRVHVVNVGDGDGALDKLRRAGQRLIGVADRAAYLSVVCVLLALARRHCSGIHGRAGLLFGCS